MLNLLLYMVTVLVWGSSWLAIKFQLTAVDPILSVCYRFLLAAAILFAYCLVTRARLRFARRDHFFLVLMGVALLGANYTLAYLASRYLESGLVSLVFGTILIWNVINLRIFLKQPVAWRAVAGGLIGLMGIGLIFYRDLRSFEVSIQMAGLVLTLLSAYLSSLGTIIAVRNQRAGLPLAQGNAFGMLYGAAFNFLIFLGWGGRFGFDWSPAYLGSFLYLVLFGTVATFGCYLLLVSRIGADYAAYTGFLTPLIALCLSTWYESYHWTAQALAGVAIVLIGNSFILTSRRRGGRLRPQPARTAAG